MLSRTMIIAALLLTPAALSAQEAATGAGTADVKPAPPPLIIPPPSAREVALPGAPRVSQQTVQSEVSHAAPVNGVITLYGNQRCPTNKDGAEVAVCVRLPKELRNCEVTPENAAWAARIKGQDDLSGTGVGSCSTVGPGGATGCFVQNANRARAESRARAKEANPDLPN